MKKEEIKVPYFNVETFGAVDGPGVRLVLFTQGCPLRCKYCHNPESWEFKKEELISADEVIELFSKNQPYYKNGGITISGGEPTAHLDFLIDLATKTKAKGIHLTIDTAAYYFCEPYLEKFEQLIQLVDLWLIDIKHINNVKYQLVTGSKRQHELKLIKHLEQEHKNYWVRQVLVPGLTDDLKDITELAHFIKDLKYMVKFEVLPYHTLALPKYENLGLKYPLKGVEAATNEQVEKAMVVIRAIVNKKL